MIKVDKRSENFVKPYTGIVILNILICGKPNKKKRFL